jgi:hypothetical protein
MHVRLALSVSALVLGTLSPWPVLAQQLSGESAIPASDVLPALRSTPGTPLSSAPMPADPLAGSATGVTGGAWRVRLFAIPAPAVPAPVVVSSEALALLADAQAAQRPRPAAFEYSDAYQTRRKIHVYASLAMLPLFVTQFALGDSLWDNATEGKHTAHVVVGSSIGVLFGVNTVTGVWNLWEGRKNPTGRARRLTHGLMMLGADAGFFATALLAPGDGGGDRDTHRAVALTSMGVATASYLFMLLTR